MDSLFFLFLLFILQIIYWLFGRRSLKSLKDGQDYFLGGKNVALFPLMMTFFATQVGGGMILGAADEAYQFGWPVIAYPLGGALGLILLGCGVGKKLASFEVTTVSHIFEIVYRSKALRKIAALLSIISLFMILAAQIIASKKFMLSLGFNHSILFVVFWIIVIIYTAQGGLKAVISTDILQASFFTGVFVITGLYIAYSQGYQLTDFNLGDNNLEILPSKICGWLLMPLLFCLIEQDMGQRCFAGASSSIVSKACLFSGLATFGICLIPIFLGTLAQHMNLIVPKGSSVLMSIVATTTNPWIGAFVGCAVLAAIISTASSLINAISSNVLNDFNISLGRQIPALKKAQWLTGTIALGAIFCSSYLTYIVDVLIQSYTLSVSCLCVPLVGALIKKEGNYLSALLSIIFGALGFCGSYFYSISIPKELINLALSLGGFLIGEWLSSKRSIPSLINKAS